MSPLAHLVLNITCESEKVELCHFFWRWFCQYCEKQVWAFILISSVNKVLIHLWRMPNLGDQSRCHQQGKHYCRSRGLTESTSLNLTYLSPTFLCHKGLGFKLAFEVIGIWCVIFIWRSSCQHLKKQICALDLNSSVHGVHATLWVDTHRVRSSCALHALPKHVLCLNVFTMAKVMSLNSHAN